MRQTYHGAETGVHEEKPLEDLVVLWRAGRKADLAVLVVLVGEVDHDRAALKHRRRRARREVLEGWDSSILLTSSAWCPTCVRDETDGVDLEEGLRLLVLFLKGDRSRLVLEPVRLLQLLEEDGDLVSIWPVVEVSGDKGPRRRVRLTCPPSGGGMPAWMRCCWMTLVARGVCPRRRVFAWTRARV